MRQNIWSKKRIKLFFLALASAWVAGVFAAPFFADKIPMLSQLIYLAYSQVCHQLDSRSFFIFGSSMAVCARCFGAYAGFLAGGIAAYFYPFEHKKRRWLLLALAPLAIDGTGQLIGIWESTNPVRLVTGLLFGFVAASFILPVFEGIFFDFVSKKR